MLHALIIIRLRFVRREGKSAAGHIAQPNVRRIDNPREARRLHVLLKRRPPSRGFAADSLRNALQKRCAMPSRPILGVRPTKSVRQRSILLAPIIYRVMCLPCFLQRLATLLKL